MYLILALTAPLFAVHLLVPFLYHFYMRRIAKKPWNLVMDQEYQPKVTLIVPAYNEAAFIQKKLENIEKIDYPNDKLEVIMVDSCSQDDTVNVIKDYLKKTNFPFAIKILEENERRGKSKALNYALEHSRNPVIAISDADAYWEQDALKKALPYLANEQVGAITGSERFLNQSQNSLTQGEGTYRKIYNAIRTGESKRHSTLIFQGELSIFKRSVFEKFIEERGSDDSGTVKNIISNGYRTLFVPEAVFFDVAPSNWKDWISIKSRRSLHLIWVLVDSIKLKLDNKFPQPSLILGVNFFLHIINPLIGLAALFGIVYFGFCYPLIFLPLLLLLLFRKFRILITQYILSQTALLLAILSFIRRDEKAVWKRCRQ